jgi:hypothetical protein
MTRVFKWDVREESGARHIILHGDINEATDFSALAAQLGPVNLLDLQNVERINSCGVREWMRFVAGQECSGKKLDFEHCSAAIVQQMNMVNNFVGKGTVVSVMAPYLCPECDKTANRALDVSKPIDPQVNERMPCPSCGADMEFDELPSQYFGFLGRSR